MKILLVSAIPPHPPDFGGAQRTNLIHRALRALGEVDLLLLFPVMDPGWRATLVRDFGLVGDVALPVRSALGPWRLLRAAHPEGAERLAKLVGSRGPEYLPAGEVTQTIRRLKEQRGYQLAVGRYLRPTCQSGVAQVLPTLVDIDDVDSQMYASRAATPTAGNVARAVYSWHARQFRREEEKQVGQFAHVFVSKPADLSVVKHPQVSVLPNIPFALETSVAAGPAPDAGHLLFVGAALAPANRAGLSWFLDHCWTGLRARHPQLTLKVVGRGWDKLVPPGFQQTGVECVGFVESLAPLYARASFAIVPIHEGGGTNIKVAEAMAHHRTAVVTTHAHRGYEQDFKHDEALLSANTADSFADACSALLTQPERRQRLGARAGALAHERYSFSAFADVVHKAARAALPG